MERKTKSGKIAVLVNQSIEQMEISGCAGCFYLDSPEDKCPTKDGEPICLSEDYIGKIWNLMGE